MGHMNSSERIRVFFWLGLFVCLFLKRVLSEVKGLQIWQSFVANGCVIEALK